MLSQFGLWAERAGLALDLVLLLRILILRLPRTYTFVTLYATLTLFYDCVDVYLGPQSKEGAQVWIFSRLIYAIALPLAIWDLFEEAKPVVEKLRQIAMSRMVRSLVLIAVWGLLLAAFTGSEENGQSHYMMSVAFVVWTGSVAAALAYLWVMKKGIKAGQLSLPHNTSVWLRYFQVLLVIESLYCAMLLILSAFDGLPGTETIVRASDPILQICAVVLTGWCIYRLRAVRLEEADIAADAKP